MHVLLIAPPIMDEVDGVLQPVGVDALRECPPLGIYALAASLTAHGHQATIVDLIQAGTNLLDTQINGSEAYDLIGIGATSMAWPTAVDVIRQIRSTGNSVPIVCGGVHPRLFDAHILNSFAVQFVLRGEAEQSILQLCDHLAGQLAIEQVENLSWRSPDGEIQRNPAASLIRKKDLPLLAEPDLSQLQAGAYKCLAIESSRGCAFDCSFCSTPYRRSWRGMNAEQFVERFERLLVHQPLVTSRSVHIVDDEFCLNTKRATEIAARLHQRGIDTELLYDARAQDILAPGLLEEIAPLTSGLLIGAECGYDEGLRLVGKGSTCATLEAAARKLAQFGIASRVDFSFIIGLPWEGLDEIKQTVQFATHLYTEYGVHIMLQWYRQIPGSRLWQMAANDGRVSAEQYDDYGFFRNYELFSTGCRLSVAEIFAVDDLIAPLTWLTELDGKARPSIVHTLPTAITDHFTRENPAQHKQTQATSKAVSLDQFKIPRSETFFPIEGVRP